MVSAIYTPTMDSFLIINDLVLIKFALLSKV